MNINYNLNFIIDNEYKCKNIYIIDKYERKILKNNIDIIFKTLICFFSNLNNKFFDIKDYKLLHDSSILSIELINVNNEKIESIESIFNNIYVIRLGNNIEIKDDKKIILDFSISFKDYVILNNTKK